MKNVISIYEILSRREIQITKLIVDGFTDKEIATKLHISYNTVRTHHRNVLKKTGPNCIGQLIRFAIERQI